MSLFTTRSMNRIYYIALSNFYLGCVTGKSGMIESLSNMSLCGIYKSCNQGYKRHFAKHSRVHSF